MANSYLNKTFSGAPTNAKKGTVSMWFKLSQNDSSSNNYYRLFVTGADGNNRTDLNIVKPDADVDSNDTAGRLLFSHLVGGSNYTWRTNRQLRDFSAYYHLVVAYDTTQASASDRVKIYINGEQETSLDNSATIPQDTDLFFGNNSSAHHIGNSPHYSPRFFQGLMAHFAYVDGTALTPTSFGETDSTSGIWKFKPPSGVTWGNNGVHLKFENSGNLGLDSSGNTHNFTVNGNLKQALDTPSIGICTLNPNLPSPSGFIISQGNLSFACGGSQWQGAVSSIAPTKGKWYYECQYTTGVGIKLDIMRQAPDLRHMATNNQSYGAYSSDGYGYQLNNSGTDYYCNNNTCTTWNSSANGNSTKIYMVCIDLDNGKYWIGAKNGTWANKTGTANPATGTRSITNF